MARCCCPSRRCVTDRRRPSDHARSAGGRSSHQLLDLVPCGPQGNVGHQLAGDRQVIDRLRLFGACIRTEVVRRCRVGMSDQWKECAAMLHPSRGLHEVEPWEGSAVPGENERRLSRARERTGAVGAGDVAAEVKVACVRPRFTRDRQLTGEADTEQVRYRVVLPVGRDGEFDRRAIAEDRDPSGGPAVPTVDHPVIDVTDLVAEVGEHSRNDIEIPDRAISWLVVEFLDLDAEDTLVVFNQRDATVMRQF